MVVCVYRYMTAENPYISLTAECLCVGGGGERREKVYVFITYLRAETPVFIYIYIKKHILTSVTCDS